MQLNNNLGVMPERDGGDTGSWIFMGVGVAAFAWMMLRNMWGKSAQPDQKYIQEMKSMREMLMAGELTQQKCKAALSLIFRFTLHRVMLYNRKLKKQRIQIKQMKPYLRALIKGTRQSKTVADRAKLQAYERLAINGKTFDRFSQQISAMKKELKKQYLIGMEQIQQLSLQKIKDLIKVETVYFKNKGKELAIEIVEATRNWSKDDKQYIHTVIPLIILDRSLWQNPEVDEADFQNAKRKYRYELEAQLKKLSEASQQFTQIIRSQLQ